MCVQSKYMFVQKCFYLYILLPGVILSVCLLNCIMCITFVGFARHSSLVSSFFPDRVCFCPRSFYSRRRTTAKLIPSRTVPKKRFICVYFNFYMKIFVSELCVLSLNTCLQYVCMKMYVCVNIQMYLHICIYSSLLVSSLSFSLSMYLCKYAHIYVHVCIFSVFSVFIFIFVPVRFTLVQGQRQS